MPTLFFVILLMIVLLVGTIVLALGRGKSEGEQAKAPKLRDQG
ncbi:MAG: hypothetical protein JWM40_10 [Frankiales bacterium]|nr:hypothetical protein [Frankiales bacterium]